MSKVNWSELRQELMPDDHRKLLPASMRVPALPRAMTEFSRRAQDPNVTAEELGIIIERDAGLTCELLRFVNSPLTGLRQKVSSAQQAIGLLGIRKTRLMLTTAAVKAATSEVTSPLVNARTFWNVNFERALFAKEIATVIKADSDLAFSATLLQDFLLTLLTKEMSDCYLEFSKSEGDQTLVQHETAHMGWTHAMAAGQLMSIWNFPDDLVCCVLLHHRGLDILKDSNLRFSAAAAGALAALMPDPLHQEPKGLDQLIRLESSWQAFDLRALAAAAEEQFDGMSFNRDAMYTTFNQRLSRHSHYAELAGV